MFSLCNGKLIRLNEDGSDGDIIQTKKSTLTFGTSILSDYVITSDPPISVQFEITSDTYGRITINNNSNGDIRVNDDLVTIKRPLLSNSIITIADNIRFRWINADAEYASWSDPTKKKAKSRIYSKIEKGRLTVHALHRFSNLENDDMFNDSHLSTQAAQRLSTLEQNDTFSGSKNNGIHSFIDENDENVNDLENDAKLSPKPNKILTICETPVKCTEKKTTNNASVLEISHTTLTSYTPVTKPIASCLEKTPKTNLNRESIAYTPMKEIESPKSVHSTPSSAAFKQIDQNENSANKSLSFCVIKSPSTPTSITARSNRSVFLIDLTTPNSFQTPTVPSTSTGTSTINRSHLLLKAIKNSAVKKDPLALSTRKTDKESESYSGNVTLDMISDSPTTSLNLIASTPITKLSYSKKTTPKTNMPIVSKTLRKIVENEGETTKSVEISTVSITENELKVDSENAQVITAMAAHVTTIESNAFADDKNESMFNKTNIIENVKVQSNEHEINAEQDLNSSDEQNDSRKISKITNLSAEEEDALLKPDTEVVGNYDELSEDALLAGSTDDEKEQNSEPKVMELNSELCETGDKAVAETTSIDQTANLTCDENNFETDLSNAFDTIVSRNDLDDANLSSEFDSIANECSIAAVDNVFDNLLEEVANESGLESKQLSISNISDISADPAESQNENDQKLDTSIDDMMSDICGVINESSVLDQSTISDSFNDDDDNQSIMEAYAEQTDEHNEVIEEEPNVLVIQGEEFNQTFEIDVSSRDVISIENVAAEPNDLPNRNINFDAANEFIAQNEVIEKTPHISAEVLAEALQNQPMLQMFSAKPVAQTDKINVVNDFEDQETSIVLEPVTENQMADFEALTDAYEEISNPPKEINNTEQSDGDDIVSQAQFEASLFNDVQSNETATLDEQINEIDDKINTVEKCAHNLDDSKLNDATASFHAEQQVNEVNDTTGELNKEISSDKEISSNIHNINEDDSEKSNDLMDTDSETFDAIPVSVSQENENIYNQLSLDGFIEPSVDLTASSESELIVENTANSNDVDVPPSFDVFENTENKSFLDGSESVEHMVNSSEEICTFEEEAQSVENLTVTDDAKKPNVCGMLNESNQDQSQFIPIEDEKKVIESTANRSTLDMPSLESPNSVDAKSTVEIEGINKVADNVSDDEQLYEAPITDDPKVEEPMDVEIDAKESADSETTIGTSTFGEVTIVEIFSKDVTIVDPKAEQPLIDEPTTCEKTAEHSFYGNLTIEEITVENVVLEKVESSVASDYLQAPITTETNLINDKKDIETTTPIKEETIFVEQPTTNIKDEARSSVLCVQTTELEVTNIEITHKLTKNESEKSLCEPTEITVENVVLEKVESSVASDYLQAPITTETSFINDKKDIETTTPIKEETIIIEQPTTNIKDEARSSVLCVQTTELEVTNIEITHKLTNNESDKSLCEPPTSKGKSLYGPLTSEKALLTPCKVSLLIPTDTEKVYQTPIKSVTKHLTAMNLTTEISPRTPRQRNAPARFLENAFTLSNKRTPNRKLIESNKKGSKAKQNETGNIPAFNIDNESSENTSKLTVIDDAKNTDVTDSAKIPAENALVTQNDSAKSTKAKVNKRESENNEKASPTENKSNARAKGRPKKQNLEISEKSHEISTPDQKLTRSTRKVVESNKKIGKIDKKKENLSKKSEIESDKLSTANDNSTFETPSKKIVGSDVESDTIDLTDDIETPVPFNKSTNYGRRHCGWINVQSKKENTKVEQEPDYINIRNEKSPVLKLKRYETKQQENKVESATKEEILPRRALRKRTSENDKEAKEEEEAPKHQDKKVVSTKAKQTKRKHETDQVILDSDEEKTEKTPAVANKNKKSEMKNETKRTTKKVEQSTNSENEDERDDSMPKRSVRKNRNVVKYSEVDETDKEVEKQKQARGQKATKESSKNETISKTTEKNLEETPLKKSKRGKPALNERKRTSTYNSENDDSKDEEETTTKLKRAGRSRTNAKNDNTVVKSKIENTPKETPKLAKRKTSTESNNNEADMEEKASTKRTRTTSRLASANELVSTDKKLSTKRSRDEANEIFLESISTSAEEAPTTSKGRKCSRKELKNEDFPDIIKTKESGKSTESTIMSVRRVKIIEPSRAESPEIKNVRVTRAKDKQKPKPKSERTEQKEDKEMQETEEEKCTDIATEKSSKSKKDDTKKSNKVPAVVKSKSGRAPKANKFENQEQEEETVSTKSAQSPKTRIERKRLNSESSEIESKPKNTRNMKKAKIDDDSNAKATPVTRVTRARTTKK